MVAGGGNAPPSNSAYETGVRLSEPAIKLVGVDGNAPRTLTSDLSGTVLQTADRGNSLKFGAADEDRTHLSLLDRQMPSPDNYRGIFIYNFGEPLG